MVYEIIWWSTTPTSVFREYDGEETGQRPGELASLASATKGGPYSDRASLQTREGLRKGKATPARGQELVNVAP